MKTLFEFVPVGMWVSIKFYEKWYYHLPFMELYGTRGAGNTLNVHIRAYLKNGKIQKETKVDLLSSIECINLDPRQEVTIFEFFNKKEPI